MGITREQIRICKDAMLECERYVHTSTGKFSSFYYILNREESPEGAITDGTYRNDWNAKLMPNINRKAQDPIGYDTSHWLSSNWVQLTRTKHLSKQWLRNQFKGIKQFHESITSSWVVSWKSIRDSLELEPRKRSKTV